MEYKGGYWYCCITCEILIQKYEYPSALRVGLLGLEATLGQYSLLAPHVRGFTHHQQLTYQHNINTFIEIQTKVANIYKAS